MRNIRYKNVAFILVAGMSLVMSGQKLAAKEPAKKKLKVVFLMGQSNMVGFSHPKTAWYMTQPMYVPDAKVAENKSRYYDESIFYWQGLDFAEGSTPEYNSRSQALKDLRKSSRALWRSRVYGNFSRSAKASGRKNNWNYKDWGDPPTNTGKDFRSNMQLFLHQKAEASGIYKKMQDHIESTENKRHPKVAIKALANRDEVIKEELQVVKDIFIKGTKPEDFDRLEEASKQFGKVNHENRRAYAEMVNKFVNLPMADRTYISAYGSLDGTVTEHPNDKITQGLLTVGYGKHSQASGPEYAFGISYEQMVDGPVLLIKCSWGGTSIHQAWRPPSLADSETPKEKASRLAQNEAKAASAKKSGLDFSPKGPQKGTGPCWQRAMAHIHKVLENPGKYHPEYDPEAGIELAGLVWFQGWNDLGNVAYGEQLVHFIKDFRNEVKAPELPIVCGLVGHAAWPSRTFDSTVNKGMLYAANYKDFKGTVDVVNTVKYFPVELGLRKSVLAAYGQESEQYQKALKIIPRSCSNSGLHYFGSAKFLCLTGNAMARSLVNLSKGKEPLIHEEYKKLNKNK